MTELTMRETVENATQARAQGRAEAFAIAAIAVALISFLNLLGAEKSVLAIVLAVGAMSHTSAKAIRRRALSAIGLAILHIVTLAVVLTLYRDELGALVQLLYKLS
jgi:hypothetical protein